MAQRRRGHGRCFAVHLVRVLVFVLLAAFVFAGPDLKAQTKPFETKAKQAFLVEASTGTVLFAKNEDDLIPPASLAKLMTAEVIFHEIAEGRLSLDQEFPVTEYAWRTGGALSRTSTMFAALKSNIKVSDLLQGMIVQSANDGAIILAEGISGSEDAFAEKMTARARELGLTKSVFANSNGLPNPKNQVTMRELVFLARHIFFTYPEFFKYYSQPDFEWNKIFQRNRNPLLALKIGVDGMKTGYTEESGYAIVATINRDGKRLFLAMSGLASSKERAEESQRVLEWGLANFERRIVFKANEKIADASVFGGDQSTVPVVARDEVDIYLPVNNPDRIRAKVVYRWPLRAPVDKDQDIGQLLIFVGDRQVRDVKVFSDAGVGTGTLRSRAFDGLKELLFFWL